MRTLPYRPTEPVADPLSRWAAGPEPPALTVRPLDGPRWAVDLYTNTITLDPAGSPAAALSEALDALAAHDATIGAGR